MPGRGVVGVVFVPVRRLPVVALVSRRRVGGGGWGVVVPTPEVAVHLGPSPMAAVGGRGPGGAAWGALGLGVAARPLTTPADGR